MGIDPVGARTAAQPAPRLELLTVGLPILGVTVKRRSGLYKWIKCRLNDLRVQSRGTGIGTYAFGPYTFDQNQRDLFSKSKIDKDKEGNIENVLG